MQAAARRIAAGQGDIEGFGGQARIECRGVEFGLARGQCFGDRIARAVDRFAGGLALVGRQRAER